jgi:ubiquinone biosynthesis monooxygenase Coq7
MSMLRNLSRLDQLLGGLQSALTTIFDAPQSSRPDPAAQARRDAGSVNSLTDDERRHTVGLMRVNHVGEVCAQALYESQAWWARRPELVTLLKDASREEADHLAWTHQRVTELGGHVSYLVPLWYVGAFAIGSLAAAMGDRVSLGFMAETENQVERHLMSHLTLLPAQDVISRAIVDQMKTDEAAHAQTALANGGMSLPMPVRWTMTLAAKVMTTTAYRV